MFRDLKEYQEIAKIYADKVSKPENLEENRNTRGSELAAKRLADKPPVSEPKIKPTYQSNRDKMIQSRSANRPKTREEVGLPPKKKPSPFERKFGKEKNEKRMISQGVKKPIPSTAEIRKANPNVVPGTRVNEVGAKGGGKPSEGDFKKDFPDKKPEVSKLTKQGKPRTKAQMMAAKRIASGKTIQQVKDENKASMKSKAAERFAAFKAKRAAKKEAKMNEDITPYDIVLEYLLSSEQAATIEEANYVMTEMDAETIHGIVEEQKKTLIEKPDDGYIGPKFLGIKNPMNKARGDFQMNYKLKKLSGTGDSPDTRKMLDIPLDYEITPEQKKKYGFK